MASIHILNIGPLEDTRSVNIKPLMLIIGRQSVGKSTFMKVTCFCQWLEKRIMTGDNSDLSFFTHNGRFVSDLSKFFRLNGYLSPKSEIHYEGDCVNIDLNRGAQNVKITKKKDFEATRFNSKLCFLPAERNLAYAMQDIKSLYMSYNYDMLFNYLLEYDDEEKLHPYSKDNPLVMPFDQHVKYYYDEASKMALVDIGRGDGISPTFTSSGIQSALPLLIMVKGALRKVGTRKKTSPLEITNLVTRILMDGGAAENLEDVDKNKLINMAGNILTYKNAHLYIEEPEENLFPESQFELVRDIVRTLNETNSQASMNSYVMLTSHSPYILSAINLLMKASMSSALSDEYKEIVGADCLLDVSKVGAYHVDCGSMVNILDSTTGFVNGDYLDAISNHINQCSSRLNDILLW